MLSIMTKRKFFNHRDRFLEVAEARTNTVLEKIRILGNCSNRQLYKYTPEEIGKIFRTIDIELNKSKAKFHFGKKTEFKLQ